MSRPRLRARRGASIAERLELHSAQAPSGCRIWTGARDDSGYGRVQVAGSTKYAHRVSYELHVGPIPADHQIDHLCRRPACIRPDHLQAVTPSVNVRRGTSPGARAVRGGACGHGHDRAKYGYRRGPRTYCRACQAGYQRKYQPTYVKGSPDPAVARELRAARLSAGLTLREVAAQVDVSQTTMCRIEHCKHEPTGELLAALREVYAARLAGAA
jgi:DNA-binding XRE family transcriptional regulator